MACVDFVLVLTYLALSLEVNVWRRGSHMLYCRECIPTSLAEYQSLYGVLDRTKNKHPPAEMTPEVRGGEAEKQRVAT